MMFFDYDVTYDPAMPVATVTLFHPDEAQTSKECTALIDSGADGTMIPRRILDDIKAPLIGEGQMRGILGIGESVDIYLVRIEIGTLYSGGIRVVAIADNQEPIIGRNVLNHLIVTLNGLANSVEIAS